MRRTLVLSCLLVFATSNYARAECQKSIRAMNSIKQSLLNKNPSVTAQQEQGQDLQNKGQFYITEFLKMDDSDSCRLDFWQAFVAMAAAASPFDMESQGAQVISKALMADRSLQSPYEKTLRAFIQEQSDAPINSCRGGQLNGVVREMECNKKQPKSLACISRFNYERCAGLPDPSAE